LKVLAIEVIPLGLASSSLSLATNVAFLVARPFLAIVGFLIYSSTLTKPWDTAGFKGGLIWDCAAGGCVGGAIG